MSKPKVVALAGGKKGCYFFECLRPATYITEAPYTLYPMCAVHAEHYKESPNYRVYLKEVDIESEVWDR